MSDEPNTDNTSGSNDPASTPPATERKQKSAATKPPAKPEKSATGGSSKKKKAPKKPPATPRDKRSISWLALLSLLVALGALGLAAFIGYQLDRDHRPRLDRQAQALGAQQERLGQLADAQQRGDAALADEVRARESAQAEHRALSVAMDALQAKLGRTTLAWRLAEVEYLLTVANHRLTLAQDVDTAIAVFETADDRLKALGDPALLPVRNMISSELIALRSVPHPDLAGMALELGNLEKQVHQLPLIDKERVATATGSSRGSGEPLEWRDIPRAVWQDLKGLVTVRRHQQPTEPLLPPDQDWFLRENLRLKLEQARLALLRTDTALFRQQLDEAGAWIGSYFDAGSAAVSNLQDSLSRLAGEELNPEIPDVSGSLKALRKRLSAREWSSESGPAAQ